MKRTLSLLLVLLMAFSVCGFAETETEESNYFFGENIYGILNTGEEALADGMDPKWVLSQMKEAADLFDYTDIFSWLCENIAAYDNKNYRKISSVLEKEDELRGVGYYNNDGNIRDRWDDYTPYELLEVSDTMRDLLRDAKAEYCFRPAWWRESEFQSVLGTSYANFKPSRPRPGYACVIIKKGAQISPETEWKSMGDGMQESLYDTIDRVAWRLEGDAPVFTGNPNLATTFWVFDLKYPYYATYGSEGKIKGYNCNVSLTVVTADGRKKIAEISGSETLPNTIYSWSDWIAKADTPNLSESEQFPDFVNKVRLALAKERSDAMANQKVNARNYQKMLDGFLVGLAEKAEDPWEKAIYEGGASNVSWDDGIVTFNLHSFDPGLEEMSSYSDRESSFGWLSNAFSNASNREVETSLKVFTGVFTHSSQTAMKKVVAAAAQKAKADFESKDMKQAVRDWLFLSPADGKVKSIDDLLHPGTSFFFWANELAEDMPGSVPDGALSALFYAQKYQLLDTSEGPNGLALKCVGIDPAKLLSDASKDALDQLAYVPASRRYSGDMEDLLLESLAKTALDEKDQLNYSFAIPISISQNPNNDLPSKFQDYLKAFDFSDAMRRLENTVDLLPSMAAKSLPMNGRMSGGANGTQVNLEVTEKSEPTYVQIRKESNGQIAATAFVHPGKTVTVYVPSGSYRILMGSGPYWYGEDEMFGDLGSYQKSDPIQIKGSNYYHTFTLENVKDGNTPMEKVDKEELQRNKSGV